MPSSQETNNRRQGQRIRRVRERVDQVETEVAANTTQIDQNAAQTAQAQRDIKMLKARLAAVEQANQQQNR